MQISKPLMTLGIMASMMPMMTSCENKESQIENPLEWMPLNRKYVLSEDKAKNDAISLQIGKNIDIFQKFAKGVEEKGFTDAVWKQFVDEYEKRNIGSKAYLEQSRAYFEKAMNDSASVDAIKEGKAYNRADRYVDRYKGLNLVLLISLGVAYYATSRMQKAACGGKLTVATPFASMYLQELVTEIRANGFTKSSWEDFLRKMEPEFLRRSFKFNPETEKFAKFDPRTEKFAKSFLEIPEVQENILADCWYRYSTAVWFEILAFNEKAINRQGELSFKVENLDVWKQDIQTPSAIEKVERLVMHKIPKSIWLNNRIPAGKALAKLNYAYLATLCALGIMTINSSLTRSEKAESQIVNAQVAEYQKFQRTGEDNHIKQQIPANVPNPQKVETQAVLPTAKMIRQETQNQRN